MKTRVSIFNVLAGLALCGLIVACGGEMRALKQKESSEVVQGNIEPSPVSHATADCAGSTSGVMACSFFIEEPVSGDATVKGLLNSDTEDRRLFRSDRGGVEYAYIVRKQTEDGHLRDYLFYFPWESNGAAKTPRLYISDQDNPEILFHIQMALPVLDDIAEAIGSMDRFELMNHMASFLNMPANQALFSGDGLEHGLPSDVFSLWQETLEFSE